MKKHYDKRLFDFGICSFAFLFPLGTFLQSIGLLILICVLILFLIKNEKKGKQINPFLFSIPFVTYLLYWFFAYDKLEAGTFLFRTTPMLIAPMLVLKSGSAIDFVKFKLFFVYGTTTMILYSFFMGFKSSISGEFIIDNFVYYQFASYVSLHPTYSALIVLCALIFLNYTILLKSRLLNTVLTLLFVVVLFLLQIRSAILLLAVLSLLQMSLELRKRNFGKVLLTIILFSIIAYSVIKQERFSVLFKEELSNKLGTIDDNGVTQRIWLWETALQEVRNEPMFGYGLRSQRNLFYKQVHKRLLSEKLPFRERVSKYLNSQKNFHNQYFQWLYDFGFFGLVVLVSFFLVLFLYGLKNKNYLFLILIVIFTSMMMTENLMDRQAGFYFYSVVLPLIFYEKS